MTLLSSSSYVRTPGLVVSAKGYAAAGGFDAKAGAAMDFALNARLFGAFGATTETAVISAYPAAGGSVSVTPPRYGVRAWLPVQGRCERRDERAMARRRSEGMLGRISSDGNAASVRPARRAAGRGSRERAL